MSQSHPATQSANIRASGVFEVLQDPYRRLILRVLHTHGELTLTDLATHLAAAVHDKPLIEVTATEHERFHADIRHAHLPRLQDAGLVTAQSDNTTVALTNPAIFDRFGLDMIVQSRDIALRKEWDTLFRGLSDEHARYVLSVLDAKDEAVSLCELSAEVAGYTSGTPVSDIPDEVVFEMAAHLHHIVFPPLLTADLIEYDTAEKSVTLRDNPDIQRQWLSHNLGSRIHELLVNPTDGNVWTISGRENVIAHGQSLFDDATEELFLMFSTEGLLEPECITKLNEAIDRGVDVYLGSQNQDVRHCVLDKVPGAVIWEPQLDWLNLPPHHESVGRLVFADRTDVMLASLQTDSDDSEQATECAIAGDGPDNPLATLLRDTLDARLDHLDEQSADFLQQIPL